MQNNKANRGAWGPRLDRGEPMRVIIESLILAQDERWRRV
jgi:hypothetical protein